MLQLLSRTALVACLANMIGAGAATAGTLTVEIAGTRSAKGVVRAGVYDAEGRQVGGGSVVARPATLTLAFTDLAAGRYAVRLYHDENGNGRLDRGAFGIPAEGYGFSNGAKARFGMPGFETMAVSVGDAAAVTTTATVRY